MESNCMVCTPTTTVSQSTNMCFKADKYVEFWQTVSSNNNPFVDLNIGYGNSTIKEAGTAKSHSIQIEHNIKQ
jgi:hypothetical protein